MTSIRATGLNGEGFIFNTTTGEWDMCANVDCSHPRYKSDASGLTWAKEAASGSLLEQIDIFDDEQGE